MSKLQVTLAVFEQAEQVVDFPENATILDVKEWVNESVGVPPEQQRVIMVQGNRVLKNGDLLNSDKKFLKLKVVKNEIGGSL
jgi:hypothetical protein